jgi:cytochrome c oxidase subunit 2
MTPRGFFVLISYMIDPGGSQSLNNLIIASANPLFGKGLYRLFEAHWGNKASAIVLTTTMRETIIAIENYHPQLVIIDCDDQQISRADFLNYFIHQVQPMRVMLVSLKETGAVVVYDRKMMLSNQIDEWLFNSFSEG